VCPKPRQVDEPVDRAQQMADWYMPLKAELVEQAVLRNPPLVHHRKILAAALMQRNHGNITSPRSFQHNPPIRDAPYVDERAWFTPTAVLELEASGACKQPIRKHGGAVAAKQRRPCIFKAAPSLAAEMERLAG
jgi:hypothetical protein